MSASRRSRMRSLAGSAALDFNVCYADFTESSSDSRVGAGEGGLHHHEGKGHTTCRALRARATAGSGWGEGVYTTMWAVEI